MNTAPRAHSFGGRALDRYTIDFRPDEEGGAATIESEGAAPERPAWLDAKFETPEALAASYAETEKEMARLRNQVAKQEADFTAALQRIEAAAPAQQQQAFNPQADPLIQLAQKAYDEGDVPTLLAVQAQINQAAVTQLLDQRLGALTETIGTGTAQAREQALIEAERRVAPLYGDRWDEIRPQLNERLAGLPATPSVEGYTTFLREQAQIIDYPRLQQTAQALADERQAKLSAQTLEGGTARVPLTANPNEEAWKEIREANDGGWNKVVNG